MTDAILTTLRAHAQRLRAKPIAELLAEEPGRLERLIVSAAGLTLDLTKQKIDLHALDALLALAQTADIEGQRARMLAGEAINHTEGRAVLHMALRGGGPYFAEGAPISPEIAHTRARMAEFAARFAGGDLHGATGERLDTIVHIGIGGSDLGPRLVYAALKPFHRSGVRLRFAANVDPDDLSDALEGLDPARTLVIVVSKTFTTIETLTNATAARAWLAASVGEAGVGAHLAAVSAAPARCVAWGCAEERVFPLWDWVGGRYSTWSAVGLSLECALADGAFAALLAGAAELDQHFLAAPLGHNLPVLSGLTHSFNRLGFGWGHGVTLPYAQRLELLPAYLQQLEMESNGKGVDRDGRPLFAPAAGVTWGAPGTNAQHSFMQLLHQGVEPIPAEFVLVEAGPGDPAARRILNANALAQAEALLIGKSARAAEAELIAAGASRAEAAALAAHKAFPGDRPSSILALDALNPRTLGALMAFYEQRTFVQGALIGINSFDQFGVELGKALAKDLAEELSGRPGPAHDASTAFWLARLAAG